MWPSFSCSLLCFQSRWQFDRKRNRKGLKDLLLLSFSFKDKCPSDHFPQCSMHGGLCDQWLWESTGIPQTTTSTREEKKTSAFSVSTTYSPTFILSTGSLYICGKHLGSFIPTQADWRTPVPSQVAGSEHASVWVLVVVEEKSSRLPTSLSGPSQSSYPPVPLHNQPPPPSLISDALKHG